MARSPLVLSQQSKARSLVGAITLGAVMAFSLNALFSGGCNFFARFEDGCRRDEDCDAGLVCNTRRRFCATPVIESCNGVDDDGDGVSDADEEWGACQPQVGVGQCGGQMKCVRQGISWSLACQTQAADQGETCLDGIDNDCNGIVDDGSSCLVNFAPSPAVRIGSNDPADGEGDDAPAHNVCVGAFSLDRFEVTQRQYAVFLRSLSNDRLRIAMPETGARLNNTVSYGEYLLYRTEAGPELNLVFIPPRRSRVAMQLSPSTGVYLPSAPENADLPVVGVTWFGAAMYCTWAGKHLPTEAEYFRAARGSDGLRPFPWGAQPPSCDRANVGGIAADGGECVGFPVAANALVGSASTEGMIFHLYGNVNEWMYDYLDDNPTHTQNRYYESLPAVFPDGGFTRAWCDQYPEGPTGPAMGSPLVRPEDAGQYYCRQCRIARGRHYRTVDLRIGIRRWLDADRSDDTVGFRCSGGGAPRNGQPR